MLSRPCPLLVGYFGRLLATVECTAWDRLSSRTLSCQYSLPSEIEWTTQLASVSKSVESRNSALLRLRDKSQCWRDKQMQEICVADMENKNYDLCDLVFPHWTIRKRVTFAPKTNTQTENSDRRKQWPVTKTNKNRALFLMRVEHFTGCVFTRTFF